MRPTSLALATLFAVILCWLIHIGILLLRKRPPKASETKRDRLATVGIVLQMCGYFLVWFQPPGQPFLPPVAALSGILGMLFSVFVVALAAGSSWLSASAIRTLGKQWALPARLVEGHKLITVGPYAYVRNPIYTAMLGMLIATGLAMEHWIAEVVAVVVFSVGMAIRVRSEEKLLRAAFGQEFEDYARRVPVVIPGFY
ncbi:MAG: methyltransferase family protein [Candidatus Sulfotelmatobacter sp.]